MNLFNAAFYRALAAGFLFGAAAVFVFAGGDNRTPAGIVPSAVAAVDR